MATFQISTYDRMIYTLVQGTLTLDEVWRLDRAFWDVWNNHDRLLMDYTLIDRIDISVPAFTQAGIASQASMKPPKREIRAAYVAPDPAVYGFTRVIEEVWSSYVTITTVHTLDEALQWLGIPPECIAEAQLQATG